MSDTSGTPTTKTTSPNPDINPAIAQGEESAATATPNMNDANEQAAIAENQRRYDEAVAGEDHGQVTTDDQAKVYAEQQKKAKAETKPQAKS